METAIYELAETLAAALNGIATGDHAVSVSPDDIISFATAAPGMTAVYIEIRVGDERMGYCDLPIIGWGTTRGGYVVAMVCSSDGTVERLDQIADFVCLRMPGVTDVDIELEVEEWERRRELMRKRKRERSIPPVGDDKG